MQNPTEALQEVEEAFTTFQQPENLTNNGYLDKFQGLVGGQPGMQASQIQDQLNELADDPAVPTNEQMVDAQS